MKKLLLRFLIIMTTSGILHSEDAIRVSEAILQEILQEMKSVVEKSTNSTIKNTIVLPIQQIETGQLKFNIVEKIDNIEESYLGNAMFTFYTEDLDRPQEITVEEKLLRFHKDYRSLIMTILIHELSHANDFYKDREYMNSIRDNKLEKYLYEMDSIYIEAQFAEAAQSQNYEMSPLETFLISSMKEDNLALASMILLQKDNKLIWYLIQIKDQFFNDERTLTSLLEEVESYGASLLDEWNLEHKESDLSWSKYGIMISMKSFQEFAGNILNGVFTEETLITEKETIDSINGIMSNLYNEVNSQWASTKNYRDQLNDYVMKGDQ